MIIMLKKQLSPKSAVGAQRGAVTVEFAFVIVLLLLIIAGIFGFGRAFWYADALTKSTRDGARLLSMWPIVDLAAMETTGFDQARTITVNSANAANINPLLVSSKVVVECLDSAFNVVADCGKIVNKKPVTANVRVSITGFPITLGQWFPFIGSSGLIDYGIIVLTPHTTMRYMN